MSQAITFECLVRFPVVSYLLCFLRSVASPMDFPAVGLIAVMDMGVTFSVLLMENSGVVMQLGVVQCKA